jgi:hypothetical protein
MEAESEEIRKNTNSSFQKVVSYQLKCMKFQDQIIKVSEIFHKFWIELAKQSPCIIVNSIPAAAFQKHRHLWYP